MEIVLILFIATFGATLLSVMSGGGASVISLPIFLWAGVPLPTALSIHKICAMFWTPVSAWNYLRKGRIEWGFLLIFAAFGLAGAYFGVQFVVHIDEQVLEPIIGGFILLLVVYTYLHKDLGLQYRPAKGTIVTRFIYPAAVVMGFYESILGSGNGIVFTALTCRYRGNRFVKSIFIVVGFVLGIKMLTGV